jgi:glycosyltransferase involved in cell wall biosynthesis
MKILPKNEKLIFFNLTDQRLYTDADDNGRYAYLTMNLFNESGFNVYYYRPQNFSQFMGLGRYGRLSYTVKNLKFTSQAPQNTEDFIYAFDTFDDLLTKKWKKLVYVNILKPSHCQVGQFVWLPYYFHPYMYKLKQNRRIAEFRHERKRIRMFFGGNFTGRYYNAEGLKKYYGKMNRIEGVNTLLSLTDKVTMVSNAQDYYKLIDKADYINEGCVFKTDHTFPIKQTKWLKIVAGSDFFVCLSGTDLPICHNAIEAMAVGTIPIISYYDWFFPSLEHKKNAIIYKDKEDLIRKVNEVFEMEESEIRQIRRNVLEYYENHLTSESFIQELNKSADGPATIMLYPRLAPTPAEEEAGRKAMAGIRKYFEKGPA